MCIIDITARLLYECKNKIFSLENGMEVEMEGKK